MEGTYQFRVFVGGISRETTEETLREYFGEFGRVASCVVVKDRLTNTSRGFAFVSFSDPDGADKALVHVSHVIAGRAVEVSEAIPKRKYNRYQQQQNFRTRKIFVGGLSTNLTEEEFEVYFEQFGNVTDAVVMRDNMDRPRRFGFITFDSEEVVENVTKNRYHELKGKIVEVKKAVPRVVNGPYISDLNIYQQGNYLDFPNYGPFCGYGYYPYGAINYGGDYPTGVYHGIRYGPLWQHGPSPYDSPDYHPFMNGGYGLRYGSPVYRPLINGGGGRLRRRAAHGYNGNVGPAPTRNSSESEVIGENNQVVAQNGKNEDVSLGSLSEVSDGNDQVVAQNSKNEDVSLGNPSEVSDGNDQVVVQNGKNEDISVGNSSEVSDGNDQVVVQNGKNEDISVGNSSEVSDGNDQVVVLNDINENNGNDVGELSTQHQREIASASNTK